MGQGTKLRKKGKNDIDRSKLLQNPPLLLDITRVVTVFVDQALCSSWHPALSNRLT